MDTGSTDIEIVAKDAPASKEIFLGLLNILTDTGIAPTAIDKTVWNIIIAQWAQGWTVNLVEALIQADIDVQVFLDQLLRRIWVLMLGECPSVVGSYVASFPYRRPEQLQNTASHQLERLLSCSHPGLEKLDTSQNPWGNVFHPPALHSWAPTTSHTPRSTGKPSAIHDVLQAARENRDDLDTVITRFIPLCPGGITGVGISAEVRAYIFCRITSIYAPVQNVMVYQTSQRSSLFLNTLSGLTSILLRQTLPIMTCLSHQSVMSSKHSWTPVRTIPFWFFLIDLQQIRPLALDKVYTIMSRCKHEVVDLLDCLNEQKNHLPGLESSFASPESQIQVPFPTVISWLVLGRMLEAGPDTKQTTITKLLSPGMNGQRHAAWLFAATIADLDACRESLGRFGLASVWSSIQTRFKRAMKSALLKASLKCYQGQVVTVCRMLLEFFKDNDTSEDEKLGIARVWVQFFVLGEQYLDAFRDMILALDRPTGKTVFTFIIKVLNPFPEAEESQKIKDIQEMHETVTYEKTEDISPYVVDHFLQTMMGIARYSTNLTQALCDGGIMTLISSIRDGWYNYPEVKDYQAPEVRRLVQKQLCDDMLKILSERMYIAAQAKRLNETPYTQTSTQLRPPVRRRPSWMATGG